MNDPIPLPDCARYLARLRSTAPPEKRGHIAVLEQQCREFHRDPAGMRKRILDTIEAIENAA